MEEEYIIIDADQFCPSLPLSFATTMLSIIS